MPMMTDNTILSAMRSDRDFYAEEEKQVSSDINQNTTTDGFKVTTADQVIHQDLCRLKLNLFTMDFHTRSKSLTSDLNDEAFNCKPTESPNATILKTARSPFSIRRVKPVKPEKITVGNNNNSNNGDSSSASRKRSSMFRRKFSHENLNDRESRMIIRRNRSTSSTSSRSLTSSLSFSQEQTSIFDTNPTTTTTTSRFRKKYSVPSRPLSDFNISGIDINTANEDIERRRRRIRSISNSVPPLPVPSIYRGYLPRSTSASAKLEETSSNYSRLNNTRKTCLTDDKSSYVSARERRNNLTASKDTDTISDKTKDGEKISDEPNGEKLRNDDDIKTTLKDRVNGSTKLLDDVAAQAEEERSSKRSDKENTKSSEDNDLEKNVLKLTINLSDRSDLDDSDMESTTSSSNRSKRSASLKVPKGVPPPLERKKSSPVITGISKANHSTESLPDLDEGGPRTPNNSTTRLKRDFHLTDTEISALRGIVKKADLYNEDVRDRMFHALKIEEDTEEDVEAIAAKVVAEKEIETLKQRLFMSRKELDSYISFTKKMDLEKRQSVSEKEELETKIQWHERRLTRFENENKSLKQERANLMNQIYELRSKSSSIKESGHARQKSVDVASALSQQSKLESSKQRFIHEADVFAQERTKLIKERQRLDEDNRKAHIRNVSLIAQVQHWEKTVKELESEKDELKAKLSKINRQSVQDQRKSLSSGGTINLDKDNSFDENNQDYNCLIETIKLDDVEITRLRKELENLEEKYESLKTEYRNLEENQITIDHENMALRDTVNVLQNAKDESDARLNEIDVKYRETLTEFKTVSIAAEELEKENLRLQKKLELASADLTELQNDAVEMESDQDAFKKFLDKLSMELQEKLGEEHVSKDKEAESLQEQAELIGREIVAHLNPSRKLQEEYEAVKLDKEVLEEEIQFLKFALANRMEIKNLQEPVGQKCECGKEKEILKRDLEAALHRLENMEDEVTRLHQDKQQLLMSFLNLQASQRSSRDVSKSGMMTDDDDRSDNDTASEGDYGSKRPDSRMRSFTCDNDDDEGDIQDQLEDALREVERLENERDEMYESIRQQTETNNSLRSQLEDVNSNNPSRPVSRNGSRPGSVIAKSESMASIASERCSNCIETGNEIRKYLSIIEELTDDKLGLEKCLNDLELDKSKCETDIAKLTESYCKIENEMSIVGSENESSVRSAKEETKMLLRNLQSLQEENQLLEEDLRRMDEDRREVLQNLKQAEEDRLGFFRTLQIISEQKETTEEELQLMKNENEALKERLETVTGGVCTLTPTLDLSKGADQPSPPDENTKEGVCEPDDLTLVERLLSCEQKANLHLALGRTTSTPLAATSNPSSTSYTRSLSNELQSPNEHPIRRVDSVENVTNDNVLSGEEMRRKLDSLKNEIVIYKAKNCELNRSLERSNTLLKEEKKRRLSGYSPATTPMKEVMNIEEEFEQETSLQTIIEQPNTVAESSECEQHNMNEDNHSRRNTMERRSSTTDDETKGRRKLYGQRKSTSLSLDEMYELFGVAKPIATDTATVESDEPTDVSMNNKSIQS